MRDCSLSSLALEYYAYYAYIINHISYIGQLSRLGLSGIRASAVNIRRARTTQDKAEVEEQKLRDVYYHIVFAHLKSFITCKYGRDLLLSEKYTDNKKSEVVYKSYIGQNAPSSNRL